MSTPKKTAKKKANVTFKDLKSKKNPKGGFLKIQATTIDGLKYT